MSWNGTVRCSYCYQSGHNRRGCEKLTLDVKERYESARAQADKLLALTDEEYKASADGKRYAWAREDLLRHYEEQTEKNRKTYLKRTKIDLVTGQKVANKAAKAERMKNVRCGYCNKFGHTRRTCQNLKNDYQIYRARTIEVRQEWLASLKQWGLGLGSMIIKEFRGYGGKDDAWGRHKVVGLVTGFHWNVITADGEGSSIAVRDNNALSGRNRYNSFGKASLYAIDAANKHVEQLRACKVLDEYALDRSDFYTVLASGTVPTPPADWLSSSLPDLKTVFPSKKTRAYEYQGYSRNDADTARWQDKARVALGIPFDAYEDAEG